jgi:hypothetical protein
VTAFLEKMKQLSRQARLEIVIKGFNYTKGRWEIIQLYIVE